MCVCVCVCVRVECLRACVFVCVGLCVCKQEKQNGRAYRHGKHIGMKQRLRRRIVTLLGNNVA